MNVGGFRLVVAGCGAAGLSAALRYLGAGGVCAGEHPAWSTVSPSLVTGLGGGRATRA